MDLSQFAVDGLVVVSVFVIVNLVVKPIIEVWISQTNTAHDPLIRGLAVLLGMVGVFVDHGFPAASASGGVWIGLVLSGILSGLSAIGLFHVALTGSASPTVTAAVVAGTMPTGAANSALKFPLPPTSPGFLPPIPAPGTVTFSPSPLHQAAGIAGTWQFPPVVVPAPPAPTGGSFTLPPQGPVPTVAVNVAPPTAPEPAPQSPSPVPVAPATPPA